MDRLLQSNPKLMNDYLREIQRTVFEVMKIAEAVPNDFCIWKSFPSAYSGKRDITFIKENIKGLIEVEAFNTDVLTV